MSFQFGWYNDNKKYNILVEEESAKDWVCIFQTDDKDLAYSHWGMLKNMKSATTRMKPLYEHIKFIVRVREEVIDTIGS